MEEALVKDLQQEICYLRSLLDAHGISYDYQSYKESLMKAVEEGIYFPFLTAEDAQFFYSMFKGRKDVFARRSARKDIRRTVGSIIGNLSCLCGRRG